MILFELYVSVTKEVKKKLLGRPDGHHGPKCGQADWCFNWKIHSHFCHIISSKLWTTCVSHIWHGHAQVLDMHIVGRYEYLTPTNIESYQLYVCASMCLCFAFNKLSQKLLPKGPGRGPNALLLNTCSHSHLYLLYVKDALDWLQPQILQSSSIGILIFIWIWGWKFDHQCLVMMSILLVICIFFMGLNHENYIPCQHSLT